MRPSLRSSSARSSKRRISNIWRYSSTDRLASDVIVALTLICSLPLRRAPLAVAGSGRIVAGPGTSFNRARSCGTSRASALHEGVERAHPIWLGDDGLDVQLARPGRVEAGAPACHQREAHLGPAVADVLGKLVAIHPGAHAQV